MLDVMREDSGPDLSEPRVDGVASANNLLLQFQADLLGVPVVRPKEVETTALGAAYLAGVAVRCQKSRQEVHLSRQADRTFTPRRSADEAAHRRSRWAEALNRARACEERTKYKEPPGLH